jgi:hypothetical protein
MNPRIALLLLLAAAAVIALTVWWISRSAGVRRKDLTAMRCERDLAVTALHKIELKADQYRDIDSVLAADVRQILRDHTKSRMELHR